MGYQSLNLKSYRKGFSLVELLVAMAIIIFMLTIMSQAFVIATTCMQGLKGVGELLDKGRPVLAVMQKDLAAYHFDGMRRLSDEDFWNNGPPTEGYFHIYQKNLSYPEGSTPDGVRYEISGILDDTIPASPVYSDHRLAFTSRLSGKSPDDFYVSQFEKYPTTAPIDYGNLGNLFNSSTNLKFSDNSKRYDFTPGVVHSQWAEIAYFTQPSARYANGIRLMDLYRQQKLIVPSNLEPNNLQLNAANISYYENFSCKVATVNNVLSPPPTKQVVYFNSPRELTNPNNRASLANSLTGNGVQTNTLYPNSDLLLTDVLSFDVRILPDSSLQDFVLLSDILSLPTPKTYFAGWSTVNPNYPTGNAAFANYSGYNFLNYFNYGVTTTTTTNYPYLPYPFYFDTWTLDRTGTPKFDLGDFSTGIWQPSSISAPTVVNPRIPLWYYAWDPTTNKHIPVKGLRINAIQVSIRVWDEKSQKAREFKLIQRL